MPGVKIHDEASPLKGAILFLNTNVNAYLEKNKNRMDDKFEHLRAMMLNDLYLTDVRFPNEKEQYYQFDLIGFKEDGKEVCFKFRTKEDFEILGFLETESNGMSRESQEMIPDIQKQIDCGKEKIQSAPF